MMMDQHFANRLNELLESAGLSALGPELCGKFEAYLALLVRWNARTNLTAVRSEDEILSRHFLESIQCAHIIPAGVKTLLDFGSGGGFPGVPIALCRDEIDVTLAESQNKKAVFLREVVRTLGLKVKVYAGRAENLGVKFDAVAMRAVDRMNNAVRAGKELVAPGGCLLLMTTRDDLQDLQVAAGPDFDWIRTARVEANGGRVVALAGRGCVSPAESDSLPG